MSYSYLASPYSHPDPQVRATREEQISAIGYILMQHGYNLFCPITQSHRLAAVAEIVLGHELCMRVDLAFLEKAEELIVTKLEGWDTSRGVGEEIAFAEAHGIPIRYLTVGAVTAYSDPSDPEGGKFQLKVLRLDARDVGITIGLKDTFGTLEEVHLLDIPLQSGTPEPATAPKEQEAGVKDVEGKDQLNLIPYAALQAIARGRVYGNNKYKDPAKWYEYDHMKDQFVTAAQRHLGKYIDAVLYHNRPEEDEESGIHHLDLAITSLALAIALRDKPKNRELTLNESTVGRENIKLRTKEHAVQRGLQDAAAGRVRKRGGFSEDLNDDGFDGDSQ